MRQVHYLSKGFLMAGICLILGACSNDDYIDIEQEQPTEKSTIHTMKMNFIGDVIGFDQQQSSRTNEQTRATTSSSWTNGDKIYIAFYNGNTIVPGEATYSSSSGWSVSYDGNLATGTNLKCEARYFVNATFSSSSLISLNSNSEIYEDVNATYAYNDGSLTVQATLSPKTGRIRFTGVEGVKINITGFSVYTTYAPAINTFSSTNAMVTLEVASNGSTPYIYGSFSNSDRNIGLIGSDFAYTRTCTADMLKTGESGYMAIPSETSHNNWRNGLYVKVNGVEFKMIAVAGHSDGFFLIAETEVTEALYNSIKGGASTSQLPISNISYPDILSFLEILSNATNLYFSLPSAAQWEYAARGGTKSQNYTYAGSNTPGDVAWYSANCSTKQNVKSKAPNELGIYDMSGNVGEFVSTMYVYNSFLYPYIYGGAYNCVSEDIKTGSNQYTYGGKHPSYTSTMRSNYNYTYTETGCCDIAIGFRPILTCP